MKAIVLHGGHGTRLRPLTHTGPKQLLPIANKPMSQYCIESIKETGINEIAIIVGGTGSSKVREYYGSGEKFGVSFTYIEQDKPKGIAHAIRLCKEFVNNEKFLVFLGDNIVQRSIADFTSNFKKSEFDATILLCEVDNPSRFGIAAIENNKITKILEKPKDPPSNLAVTGIYFLTPIIFDVIDNLKPSGRNELEITDALDILLEKNHNISFEMITDYWKDTGTPEDILNANRQVLEHICNQTCIVDESSITLSNSNWITPSIIGKNCKIDKSARIGPNASIGDNTIISSDVVIENSIIMSDCKIHGGLNIRDSIISANCHLHGNNKDKTKKIFLLGEGTKITL
ncbi:glucose-1-phosphate thymidylyltransferase [Marine Group I thaumarchaeote]|uniref:Glucose-1-phosphate thymidylyltransferase n=1 Tax=Marine Group I thaumarchaeote TaxID=2511932 RepID=A0A7K4NMI0_9ARCH|nr:glucose-1-phosphate thymidylyltransferase [Marine Group I thaumarchaeote]